MPGGVTLRWTSTLSKGGWPVTYWGKAFRFIFTRALALSQLICFFVFRLSSSIFNARTEFALLFAALLGPWIGRYSLPSSVSYFVKLFLQQLFRTRYVNLKISFIFNKQRRLIRVLHCDKTRRTFENTSVFYVSRVFSNVQSALSQWNTRLRLLHLLYDIDFTRAKQWNTLFLYFILW